MTLTTLHMHSLAEVAVPLPLFHAFTYRVPPEFAEFLAIGMRVLVPFGKRLLTGYVTGFPEQEPRQELKQLCDVLDAEALFSEEDLNFYQWVATYYHYPLGQTIKTALPTGINIEYGSAAVLTEKGKKFLAELQGDFPGKPVLLALHEEKEIPLKQLEKKAGKQGFNYHLSLLTRKGLIALSLKKKGGAVGIRKERWFSAAGNDAEQKLKGKQKELLRHIAEKEPVSVTSLREQFGSCAITLKALEEKGLLLVEHRELLRRPPVQEQVFIEPVHEISPDQKKVLAQLEAALEKKMYFPLLLHGVTGSGKTEIYLKVMEQVLQGGGQCLYLVPEIALTAQLYDRISSRLQAPLAMLHSGLTAAERFDAWRMIARGEVSVVVGARSAIFASFKKLGVIVIDEEHDPSYKQEEQLRYNARDIALVKGRLLNAIVIMGSATPSLESYYNASRKKYSLGVLAQRVENRPLPQVGVIDMKIEAAVHKKNKGIISRPLQQALAQRLADGRQSILFLNRRGFSPALFCQQCGYTFTCPNCAVSLSHHKGEKKLSCHYCDFSMPVASECPSCRSYFLLPLGWGTERLEAEIKGLFPQARLARMDKDTTGKQGALHAILKGVYRGEIDILIGTQMLVKGYHLPNVTLVGILCADQSLNFPDYRAGERTFQLLTQVAGRAGRGNARGEVIIQAYNPDHYSIACAREHDFKKFYDIEMKYRKELGYPPYRKILNVRFEGTNKNRVEDCSRRIGELCARLLKQASPREALEVLGPARAPWEKIQGRYRYQLLIKGGSSQNLRSFIA
ncbi:MAG: primosomal protein N', partial [Pseudomonadota bacterium]